MKHTRLVAAVSALLLGTGLAFAQQADLAPKSADLACTKLDVGSAQEPRALAKTFSATKTVDLAIMAYFAKKPSHDHVIEFKLTNPDGFLYRSMSFPIAASTHKASQRAIAGYPNPVREVEAIAVPASAAGVGTMAVSGQTKVEVPFPVAGTDIVTSGLYGKWKVEAFLDGASTPCTQPLSFTLKP